MVLVLILPVILIAIDFYKGRSLNAKSVIEKIPLLSLSLLFGIVNIYAQKSGGPVDVLMQTAGFFNALFLVTSGITSYIIRAVIPFSLCFMHYFPMINNGALPWVYYLSLPFLLVIASLSLRRTSFRKEIIFGFAFFLIAISVMLQIIAVGSALISERYTYISYFGLFYIIGQWIANIGFERWKKIIIGVFSLTIIVFSVQTWDRIDAWKDSNVLCTDVIEKNPGILDVNFIYLLRGNCKGSIGDFNGALEDYNQAIIMNPQFSFEYSAYYCRGHVNDVLGNIQAAISDYNNAIQLKPDLAEAWNNRGWDYFQTGFPAKAIPDLDKAISLKADYFEAYNNRGWIYYQSGDIKSALADFSKAIALNPAFDKPYYNRAEIKFKTQDFEGAIEDFNSILRLHPEDNMTYYRRGMARSGIKDNNGACSDWKRAADLGNKDAIKMIQQYCH